MHENVKKNFKVIFFAYKLNNAIFKTMQAIFKILKKYQVFN